MTRAVTSVNLGTKVVLSVEETATLPGETRPTLYKAIKTGPALLPVLQICGCRRTTRRVADHLNEGLDPFGEESTDGAGALAFDGHRLTKSRCYSVTFSYLRGERQGWCREAARWQERIGSRWRAPTARELPNMDLLVVDGANRAGGERRL